jgi:hypothetical protein
MRGVQAVALRRLQKPATPLIAPAAACMQKHLLALLIKSFQIVVRRSTTPLAGGEVGGRGAHSKAGRDGMLLAHAQQSTHSPLQQAITKDPNTSRGRMRMQPCTLQ